MTIAVKHHTYCSFRIRRFGQFKIERLCSLGDRSDVRHLLTRSSVSDAGSGLDVREDSVGFDFRRGSVDGSRAGSGASHPSGRRSVADGVGGGRGSGGEALSGVGRCWKWSAISIRL